MFATNTATGFTWLWSFARCRVRGACPFARKRAHVAREGNSEWSGAAFADLESRLVAAGARLEDCWEVAKTLRAKGGMEAMDNEKGGAFPSASAALEARASTFTCVLREDCTKT